MVLPQDMLEPSFLFLGKVSVYKSRSQLGSASDGEDFSSLRSNEAGSKSQAAEKSASRFTSNRDIVVPSPTGFVESESRSQADSESTSQYSDMG